MNAVVKLSGKNQIVIPKEVRRQLHLGAGDELFVEIEDGKVVMFPKPKSYTKYALGLGREVWRRVEAAKYVKKERASWEKKQKPGKK